MAGSLILYTTNIKSTNYLHTQPDLTQTPTAMITALAKNTQLACRGGFDPLALINSGRCKSKFTDISSCSWWKTHLLIRNLVVTCL